MIGINCEIFVVNIRTDSVHISQYLDGGSGRNSRPLLSICIATLNRAAFIGETLDSIIPQLTQDVELVVLDGGSADGTRDLMEKYEKKCPYLRYIRRETNSGVDRDYDIAVEMATGEYCWLMTDDDLLQPDSVATILDLVLKQYALIVVNAEVRNADFSEVLEDRKLKLERNAVFTSSEWDCFFAQTCAYLSFIGCVVIKRTLWISRRREPYFGTLFIHVGIIFQTPLPADIAVVSDPQIVIRFGNAMWRPKEFEIWMFKWPDLVWSFPGISVAAKKHVCSRYPWQELATLFFYRAKGTYNFDSYRQWIRPRSVALCVKFMALLTVCIPGVIANLIALTYCRLGRRNRKMMSLDLENSPYYFGNILRRRGQL